MMIYLLMVVCFFFDIMYIICKKRNKNIIGLICKSIASSCFIIIGYLAYKNHDSYFNYYILLGLLLDGLGDVFLALRNIFLKNVMFFTGAFSFLIGHCMYVKALYPLNNDYLLQGMILGIGVGALVYVLLDDVCGLKKEYRWIGIVYCIAISIMACLSTGVYLTYQTSSNLVYMLGTIAFVTSDILLILNTFSKKISGLHPAYSVLYYLAQILISYSLFL